MGVLRRWWNKLLLLVFHRSALPQSTHTVPLPEPPPLPPLWQAQLEKLSPPPTPAPDIVPLLAMDIPPPPEQAPVAPQLSLNRHERRQRAAFERARRKHDKFVTPLGPEPVHYPREHHDDDDDVSEPPLTKHEEPLPAGPIHDDPNDRIIADEWLEGDGEMVLYEEAEFFGQFNFRDTILEQLDRYWVYLSRMRKGDPDAYEFYKQIGATLVPYSTTNSVTDKPKPQQKIKNIKRYKEQIVLTPWFKEHWPVFGCCAFGTNPRDEKRETTRLDSKHGSGYLSCPKFLYFRRIERFPWTVQPVRGGKCYVLTVWWDRVEAVKGHKYKWGRPMEFPVHISDDGKRIRVLKTRKDGDGKTRSWWDWRIPHDYERWAKQYGLDAQTHLGHLFCDVTRDIENTGLSMLRVEVTKGDMTAVFGLDPRRTGYFFQDRDIVLNENGRKRRVFHMVRPFVDKKGVAHPTSFRGMREFTWAGYSVFISVPGRDHFMLDEFNLPMHYNRHEVKEKTVSEGQLAATLREQLHKEARMH